MHLVATPIGNASDITLRALDILHQVAVIACEDTRVTAKLLSIHGITTPRLPYHDHNAEEMRPRLLARLQAGEAIALVSDAGTPLISDPGYKLARAVIDAGLPIHVLPGASAPLAALLLSGLPSDRFLFAGFLEPRTTARRKSLAELAGVRATLIFFESGPRLAESLADMADMLGAERQAAVAREVTKLYEETIRLPLGALARHYATEGPPRGEIVIVIGPPPAEAPPEGAIIDQALREALTRASRRDAVEEVATRLNLPRREVYSRALALDNPS